MQARREVFPGYYPDGAYPPNTILVASRLVQPELLVEIEAMAVRPAMTGPGRAAMTRARRTRPAVTSSSRRRSPVKKRS